MSRGKKLKRKVTSLALTTAMAVSMLGVLPESTVEAAASDDDSISNGSLTAAIGDLGEISSLTIDNNRKNSSGKDVNFVLPNDTNQQNNEAHQWMGEMIFSYRSSKDGKFPEDNSGFQEVDTNKTLAAGGSTTYSNASANLKNNPYIEKKVSKDKVEVTFKGQDEDSTDSRTMKGFNAKSVYDMDTDDGSLLWSITLENTSGNYLEFGDVGLPMPWNNKYASIDDTYNNRTTVHTFAGADSGYAYAIRCSGEGNYVMFTPVTDTGARIEYIDNWTGNINGVKGTRSGSTYQNWTSDTGGWFPGLQVYYIHSKDIQKTGRGYYTDATSLVLKPGEKKTYQFKFSAVRAGDNTPQNSAEDANNASDSVEERENNMRSILYKEGMIDAVATPGFQTAINMPTKLDLHYDDSKISDVSVDIQCVHENDPWDEEHIPDQQSGMVNNSKSIEHSDSDSAKLVNTKTVDGEKHHIYELNFGCIGNNSVRVNYKLNGEDKFTQYEFNVLDKLDSTIETHSDFVANQTQDNDTSSPTYGIYSDWYFASGKDSTQQSHWGDDWSHDNINFMAMKNYLDPNASEVESIEKYLIDFMWNNYMKNSHETYAVANYLSGSGIYGGSANPYSRTYSEVMEATGFFNMYRIEKAYPDLIDYRESAEWYLEKAYGIYSNRVSAYPIGFYGEQQIPDMIEALYAEGMTEEGDNLKQLFAKSKGTSMATAAYPYGSEFEYDNTGEEGAYSATKALRTYYPDNSNTKAALKNMQSAEWKTRAMRGLQPTWYQYADPVFRGGETWWNFQYTASLAGYIMDDWLRYEDTDSDTDSSAWAERMNYAAKLSNFNAVNMGQISSNYIGNTSWRYTMSKGGYGAQNVNDGGTRVQNNGWNDFSGESDEGLYGSLLSISADVATDPVFGLTGYGSTVSKSGGKYTITPLDGVGKRINVIDDKLYVELEQDSCTKAVIDKDGTYFDLAVKNLTGDEHLSKISLSGAGLKNGYYSIKVNGEEKEQCYVSDNQGDAYAVIPAGESAKITIEAMKGGENQAPKIYKIKTSENPQALVSSRIEAQAYDDGAPDGKLTYKWETVKEPEDGELTFDAKNKPYANITASKDGIYKVKLTVSDGELSTEKEVEIEIGRAPEKTAPVIESATATQHPTNTTTAELSGKASTDKTYGNKVEYKWSVVDQPEGGNAIIANAEKADAKLKAYVPGTYTLRLTATDKKSTEYDADVESTKDIVLEMKEPVDGIERVGTVLTKVKTEPELPEKMEVIYEDGTIKDSEIVWDQVDEESYAHAGNFTVNGTVKDTDLKVEVTVMVVSGEAQNVALIATPSAIIDTPEDLGGVAGLNDGYDPASSNDKSHGVWHNWLGDNGADAWVQYDWESEVTIYQSDAYYFTDGNFVPKSVSYQYKDANGNWRDLPNVSGCGTELNKYNTTTFAPVTTTAIRMNMSPKTQGCGVIEWKVYGYAENVIDKTLLKKTIDSANALDLTKYELTEEDKAALTEAIQEAVTVNDNKEATQEEVDFAAAKLARIMSSLPTADGNLAYGAAVSTSYVSSWEKVSAVNDGKIPESSYNPSGMARYGTWGNASSKETVTYTWNQEMKLTGADIYLWYDGDTEGDYTKGGIKIPKSYTYEYLDSEGNWKEVPNPSSYGMEMDKFNNTTFDEITTKSIRVTLNKQANDTNGVGVMEWKVYGTAKYADENDKADLEKAVKDAETEEANLYTEDSYKAFEAALKTAKSVLESEKVSSGEVKAALAALVKAQNNLVKKAEDKNIAPKAAVDGICNYTTDLGGLAQLNNNIDPSSSRDWDGSQVDAGKGMWHNWNNRYDADGNVVNAWVSYTWDSEMVLESTDVYYGTDGGGIQPPKSVKFEYLNEAGEWKEVPNAEGLGCEKDKYNTTKLGNIKTKAIRMVMEPEFLSDADPAHGIGVLEWKVNGTKAADLTALKAAIQEAEGKNESDYTASSWKTFAKALEEAKAAAADNTVTQEAADLARTNLLKAANALVKKGEKPEYDNIAPEAKADGICDYTNDLGGLATLNDGYEPTESHDTSHGAWHNWNNRYENGVAKNAWVSYTWDKPVEINSMDIYYFSDHGGIVAPKSASFEYLNDAGEWVVADEAQGLACVEDEYNTVKLANIKTKAIRMTMEPEFMNDGDPAHGVGVIEWKVYGKYAEDKPETVDKTALDAVIREAESRAEKDYTSDSWETFARVLESAKAVQKNESATQEEVDNATALLTEAMDNLEPVKEEPVKEADKKELKKAIANAEKYTRVDYTEESWNDFQTALQAAYLVDNNTAATQKEVDDALQALQTAIKNLKKVQEEVKKDDIRKYIEKAQKLNKEDYTKESWDALQEALKEAVEAANKDDVTQAEIDQKTEALKQAIGNLKKADGKDTGKDNNKNNDNKGNGQNVSNNNANGKNPKGGNHKNVGKNNKNNNGNAAKTGDTMPVIPIASAVAAFAVIAEIIRRRIKNR